MLLRLFSSLSVKSSGTNVRYVFGLTSEEHLEFTRSTELYHEVSQASYSLLFL